MEDCLISSGIGIAPARRAGVLCAAVFVLSCAPAACVHAAVGIAEIIDSMPPGTWHELSDTHMSVVFPPKAGHPAWGVEGPGSVVSAWGGAAFDTERNLLIITGGGHRAYGGNEVYEFSLETLQWARVTEPSAYEPDPNFSDAVYVRTLDGSPISSHTYDGLQYIPTIDAMFMFGGSQWEAGINYDQHPYLFDMVTSTWTRKAKAPTYSLQVASAWDRKRNRVLVVYKTGVMAYYPASDSWENVTGGWYSQAGRVAAYDPEHDLLLLIGRSRKPVAYLELSGSGNLKEPDLSGDLPLATWRVGLTYDRTHELFVVWGGNRSVWTINPDTWEVKKYKAGGDAPSRKTASGKDKNHGTYSRWQYVPDYDVFIGYNSAQDNVWLYRLPEVPQGSPQGSLGTATTPAAPRPSVQTRTQGSGVSNRPAPTVEAPALPPPGRVVVAPTPSATQTSFPPPGQLIVHPGSRAQASESQASASQASASQASESVTAVLERENCGADLCVGPDYRMKLPSQAAKAAQKGDTVAIEAGEYKDCAVWPVSVTIKGINGTPKIGGTVCSNKAIWITQGAHTVIKNVALHGALGGTSNAAAIRHEGKALIVRNAEIYDNHNGILVGHDPEMTVEVYDSVFHHMWTRGDLAHNIYVGKIAELIVEGNYFYDGQSGHFIKTLAAHSRIAYNRIIQKKNLNAALIDIWGCQDFQVVGNAMMRTGRYGALSFIQVTPRKGVACPNTRIKRGLVAYNTVLFNNKNDTRWSNLLHYNYPALDVHVANNLAVHTRDVVNDSKGFVEHGGLKVGNIYVREWKPGLFVEPSAGDLHLVRPLSKAAAPIDFVPLHEPALPVGTRPRASGRDVGAFAYEVDGGS